MDLIMDGLLVAGALFAGSYCWVLSRRVAALKDLDSGLGGAITQMTRALEDARRALEEAKAATRDGRQDLRELVTRADAAAGQLRILLAASRDLVPPAPAPEPRPAMRSRPAPQAVPQPRAEPAVPRMRQAAPAAEPTGGTDGPVRAGDAMPAAEAPAPATAPRAVEVRREVEVQRAVEVRREQPVETPHERLAEVPRERSAEVRVEQGAAAPDTDEADDLVVPKPRQLFPLQMLRPRPVAVPPAPEGERDILAELAALAGGRS